MRVTWLAVVAGLIAVGNTLPRRRVTAYGTAAVLRTLGVLLLAVPEALPGLCVAGSGQMEDLQPMDGVEPMGSALPRQL